MYALVKDGAILRYPYSVTDLRRDNPGTSFPRFPSDDTLEAFGVVTVETTAQPVYDPIHERPQDSAVINGNAVVQVWTINRRDDIQTVDDFAAAQLAQIKTACGEIILDRLPIHRQLNYQQRAIELLDIRRERDLTAAEMAERDFIMGERDWLNAMRAHCNGLEATIAAIVAGDDSDDAKRAAIAALNFVPVP
jgi:hypothetical protein